MFEVAEIGHTLDKTTYRELEPAVNFQLLQLQQRLQEANRALIIIVAGVEGAGKGEVVDKLNYWLDTRSVTTHAFWDETDEERNRPLFWRYWRTLPSRGRIGIMFSSWYTKPIRDRVFNNLPDADFESALQQVEDLEQTLVHDGTVIVKLWFHLSEDAQKDRLEADVHVAKLKTAPDAEKFVKSYKALRDAAERAIRLTEKQHAPWHIIEATDTQYRNIAAGRVLIDRLQEELAEGETSAKPVENLPEARTTISDLPGELDVTILDKLDLSKALEEDRYREQLERLQTQLHKISWRMHSEARSAVVIFEGWDAAGKGSTIRRLTAAIDARLYRVIRVGAPTDEELAHHYLWRFWRQVPPAGYLTIYDRSWYGRVLVERVEGFANRDEWLRSYQEINNFEEHLTRHGIAVVKFWLHISKDKQLERFNERQKDPRKQHKITPEDWRNRENWNAYREAVSDMVAHTSTRAAPWHLVEANDKKFARVKVLESMVNTLSTLVNKG